MITGDDLRRAEACTTLPNCEQHPRVSALHSPWLHVDVDEELSALVTINEALELAIPDAWDDDASWESIAATWIEHMATTHGAHCVGPQCEATAETPAYVAVIRAHVAAARRDNPTTAWRLEDLAHELGVDLGD